MSNKYIGDITEDEILYHKFSSKNLSQVPTTLAGTPVVKVYKDDATGTESTAGITLTVDFDSVTGMNNLKIDTSSDAFYATGADYHAVITTGTVDSISVVGTVVCTFSIENRYMRGTDSAATASALTTHDGKLDTVDTNVDTLVTRVPNTLNTTVTGNIGVDWANVENAATAVDLAGTDIQLCDTVTTNTDLVSVADILTTQMTEAYAADGVAPTLAQAIFLIQQSIHEFAIVNTTRTVKKLDGTTSAATFTLDDDTSPTSTTRAT